jgi:DNA-binding IclR family transcriptional regulator
MVSEKKVNYSAPGLERGLKILEYLSQHPSGKGQVEIAQALNVPVSSVFRMTLTLEKFKYIERDPDTKVFRYTQKMLMLAQRALAESNLIGTALPIMRDLRDKLGDTLLIGVLSNAEIIVLEQALGSHLFRFSVNAGHHIRVHCSAPGKAILAYLGEVQLESLVKQLDFKRFTANTITSVRAFRRELTKVRKLGYAVDNGEEYEGIYCVGSTIFDRIGDPVASVWVTGPATRVTPEMIPSIGELIREGADTISRRMGYTLKVKG